MKFLFDHDVPEDLSHLLRHLGHEVRLLREVLPQDSLDPEVLRFAHEQGFLLITCNRDDFLALAARQPHAGSVIVIRRKSRTAEKAAVLRLLEFAGESGLSGNINFA